VLRPIVSGSNRSLKAPWIVKLLDTHAWLRRWPAQFIGIGLRPEHVQSPDDSCRLRSEALVTQEDRQSG
jgi:hypothetical protein